MTSGPSLRLFLPAVLGAFVMSSCVNASLTGATPVPTPRPTPPPTAPPTVLRTSPPDPNDRVKVPDRINATGEKGASRALQRFIDEVPDGSTIVFPAGAVYNISFRGISLDGRRDLTFIGNGAELRFAGCDIEDSAFHIGFRVPSSGIAIRDIRLVGDNPGGYVPNCESAIGVAMYGSSDIEIDRVTVTGPRGHCWYADHTNDRWTSNVWIHDSRCIDAGVMGVAIVAGRDILVERNTFTDVALIPFDIEPGEETGGGESITFWGNIVDGYGLSADFDPFLLAADVDVGTIGDVTFAWNVVVRGYPRDRHDTEVGDLSIGMRGRIRKSGIRILNNRAFSSGRGPVMRFRHVDGLTVTGNYQPLDAGRLVQWRDSTDVVVEN